MRVAAAGQAEAGSGLRRTVGVCGEGGFGREGDDRGPVGAESSGAAAAARDAARGGACETGWISLCQAQRGTSGAQGLGVAGSGDGMGAASAAAPAVCGARRCLRCVPRCRLRLACRPRRPLLRRRSGRGSARACPGTTPRSSASPGSARADVEAARGCSAPLPPPELGTGAGAGAGWFVTGTEADVCLSPGPQQHFPSQLAVG